MSIIDSLIYDRLQQDVDYADRLNHLGLSNMTPVEREHYLSGLKGAYNASDLNRVGEALLYIQEELKNYGYELTISPRVDWTVTNSPKVVQMETYLANVAAIRGVLEVFRTTPQTPATMNKLTFQRANDIEKILADVQKLLNNMQAAFRHCGAAVCGGGGLLVR